MLHCNQAFGADGAHRAPIGLWMAAAPQLPRMVRPSRMGTSKSRWSLSHWAFEARHMQWREGVEVCQDKSGMVWKGILTSSLKNG